MVKLRRQPLPSQSHPTPQRPRWTCQPLPVEGGTTTLPNERAAQRTSEPQCAMVHRILRGLGVLGWRDTIRLIQFIQLNVGYETRLIHKLSAT